MGIRNNLSLSVEIKEIAMADAALIIAMALWLSGGLLFSRSSGGPGLLASFVYYLPIAAVAVSVTFVLHELMHKFTAQHYGAIAGFRSSHTGLMITLITGAFGFLIGIPGATVIFAHNFDRRQNGLVSLAGPLTNFAVFGVALLLLVALGPAQGTYLFNAIYITLFISIILAFFNMLPMYPLDGSKVLAWSKPIYLVTMAAIFILMILFTAIPLYDILIMLVMAVFFSMFYRSVI
ncbi:site-2 protease family protein [Candidatus Marsarchaeota archaeon]|nr:site-2 protease family protein [Candidatus Marsarchaeota archaeon]